MSFSIGIIGLPNVGKSTLFKAITKKQVNVSNYPFCTIDPNVSVVAVPDERLEKIARISKCSKITPTIIEFIDIAGLVKGAHKGEGLGNKFLSHIQEVDAIAHIVRLFENKNVSHVYNKIDPKNDIESVNSELILKDLEVIEKRIKKLETDAKSGDKKILATLEVYKKIKQTLDSGELANTLELKDKEKELTKDLQLLTSKPILYVLNIDEKQLLDKKLLNKILITEAQHLITISAKLESELSEFDQKEVREYIKEFGITESGINKLIKKSYELLDLITFFTVEGKREAKAWTIKKGTNVQKAAGKIHSDFENKFIKAEVINWNELINSGSYQRAKEKGVIRIEGKNYVVQDGDVVTVKI